VGNITVVLIGFMATGKSTIGRALGRKLDLPVLDLDREIRRQFGLTIPEIFEQHGEAAFRKAESDFLAALADERRPNFEKQRMYPRGYVFSTGGGTPLLESNRALLREIGPVVWLRCKPETIAARCRPHIDRRPILHGHADDLDEHIDKLLAIREPNYEQASTDTVWTDDDTDADNIAEQIKQLIRQAQPGR
jgi:shikimate kinase